MIALRRSELSHDTCPFCGENPGARHLLPVAWSTTVPPKSLGLLFHFLESRKKLQNDDSEYDEDSDSNDIAPDCRLEALSSVKSEEFSCECCGRRCRGRLEAVLHVQSCKNNVDCKCGLNTQQFDPQKAVSTPLPQPLPSTPQGPPESGSASDRSSPSSEVSNPPLSRSRFRCLNRKAPFVIGNNVLFSVVGRGSFGSVWFSSSIFGEPRAVKIPIKFDVDQQKAEVRIMEKIRDVPAIAPLLEAIPFPDYKPRDESPLVFVFPFYGGGTLTNIPNFDANACKNVSQQLCQAVLAMHLRNVCHADIKPENVLWEPDPLGGYKVYLSDFGTAREYSKPDRYLTLGTRAYWPPQAFCRKYDVRAADIWALGATLYKVAFKKLPVVYTNSSTHRNALKQACAVDFVSSSLDDEQLNVIKGFLDVSEEDRLTAFHSFHAKLLSDVDC